ncbi:type IV toxin-antitoxin system AbiEi family antitoxin domain-containing protein [Georgenia sp. MJ170]|uniref:type IV toxin-antitoxin system AbiEi family antitoxin domain-containing protein n=1 Tax=Georgenia sunbinii TaxID=3117728 RepID=UPI002F26B158
MAPDPRRLDHLAARRASVLTRRELLAEGATPDWISRQVSGKRWQRVYPGVYVTHTGPLGWRTSMVAALRYAGRGAALSHRSAKAYWVERNDAQRAAAGGLVEVSVPWSRVVRPQPGLRVHRRRRMPEVRPGLVAVTAEAETALDLVDRATGADDVVGILTQVCRRLPPADVLSAAEQRSRLRHRAFVVAVLADVEDGVESPMEHRYHRDVEDAHGLPAAQLQVREKLSGRWIRADCRYRRYRVRIELDGQLAHPGGRTDLDTWRDNAALLATDEMTLRYRWRHVGVDACQTAVQVITALRRGGWTDAPRPCGPRCPVAALPR